MRASPMLTGDSPLRGNTLMERNTSECSVGKTRAICRASTLWPSKLKTVSVVDGDVTTDTTLASFPSSGKSTNGSSTPLLLPEQAPARNANAGNAADKYVFLKPIVINHYYCQPDSGTKKHHACRRNIAAGHDALQG